MRWLPLLVLAACAAAPPSTAPTRHGGPGSQALPSDPVAPASVTDFPTANLADVLEPIRAQHGLPALAALVLRGDDVIAEGAVGVRRADGDAPVTLTDRWHLGSCTKSMTATLCALHVARGTLAWDTTVGAVFGDVEMDPAWRDVTLAMLLTNSSGAPTALDADGLWHRLWERLGTPVEQRRTLVEGVLARPPAPPPGTRYQYSNAGFSIAGAMLERLADEPYEALLARDLFEPLGMAGAGFGAPGDRDASGGEPTEPLGHAFRRDQLQPVELGFGDDNPPGIAPAGLVHAPLRSWARYAALHLAAARGEPLSEPFDEVDFARLHRPGLGNYAMGWVVTEPAWAEGRLLWHNGSNTWWYCELAILPKEDLAILVATNTSHGTTRAAVGGVAQALLALHRSR